MIKTIFISFIVLLIFSCSSNAQNNLLNGDSIIKSIQKQNISENKKAEKYEQIYFNIRVSNPQLAIQCLHKTLEIYEKNGDEVKVGALNASIAEFYNQAGLYELSVKYLIKAYDIYSKNNMNIALAWLLIDMGNIYFAANYFDEAKKYYDRSFEKFKDVNMHLGMSVIFLNYGLIKEKQKDIDSALYYFDKSLKERKFTYDPYLVAHIYHYMARAYIEKNSFAEARKIINKSNDILLSHPKTIDLHLQLLYSNLILIAESFEKINDNDSALLYADSALGFAYINTDTLKIIEGHIYMGKICIASSKPLDAVKHYLIANEFAQKEKYLETKSEILFEISIQYMLLGDYKKAETYTLEHKKISKELNTFNENKKNNALVLALESQFKNLEIEKYKYNVQKNKTIILILLVCIILALFFSIVFYYFKNRLWKSNKELINTAFDGVVIHQQGVIYDANVSFLNFSGYSLKELKNASIYDFLDPLTHDDVRKGIIKNLSKHLVLKIKHKNGAYIDVELQSRPFIYFGKKMRLVTMKDISEQLKANAQIELFKTIIEQNYTSIVITDTKGSIEYVNKSFSNMTGYSSEEAIGKNPKILKSSLHDDSFYKNLWNTINAGKAWNGTFKNINKQGAYFWEEATITPIKDKEGNIIKFAAIKRDITQRRFLEDKLKQFNELFKKIFESIDAFVFVIDFETENIISANLKTKFAFGDVVDKNFNEVLFNDSIESYIDIPKNLLIDENEINEYDSHILNKEVYLKSKDSWYDFNMRMIPWIENTKAILIVANDITYNKNTILRLNELNATKDKFFSIISHDLKNPFQGLLGFSEILLNDFDLSDTKKVKLMITHINNISKTSFRLLENLLEWANLQKGLTQIEIKNFNLEEVILQTIALKEPFYSKKDIVIKTQIPASLKVFSDINIVMAITRNLLSNAIKFTPQKGEILIKATENDTEVIISVKDNGVGIPQEMLPKLFQIETKYSVVGTEGETGNGLGLILCKEFVGKIGGKIYAESKVDEGTTFFFTVGKAR